MRVTTTLRGLEDVDRLLGEVSPRVGFNLMRATVGGIASGIAKDAKSYAPEDEGDLKKSIKTKRERPVNNYLWSSVRVNPVAFYWRFLEYGQGPDGEEHAMFMRAVEKFNAEKDRILVEQFGKKWEAALKRAAKRG